MRVRVGVAWAAVVSYCALIFWLSAQSHPPGIDRVPTSDKVMHAGAFGLMAALATFAARATFRRLGDGRCALLGFAYAVLYGISDEVHQRWTPGRTPDPLDALADALGAMLACTVMVAVLSAWRRRRRARGVGDELRRLS